MHQAVGVGVGLVVLHRTRDDQGGGVHVPLPDPLHVVLGGLDGPVDVAVQDATEDRLQRLGQVVEGVGAAGLVAPNQGGLLGPHHPAHVALLRPVGEEGVHDLLELQDAPVAGVLAGQLLPELNVGLHALVGRLHEHAVGVRVYDREALVLQVPYHRLDVLPGEGGYRLPYLPVGEAVEGGGEDAVEAVHQDLHRLLEAVVIIPLLVGTRRLHLRLDGVPLDHQLLQDAGQQALALLGGDEPDALHGRDVLAVRRKGGEAHVVGDDDGRVHRLEVQGDYPVVEPRFNAVDVGPLYFGIPGRPSGEGHPHVRPVRLPDEDGVDELAGPPVDGVVERELRHRRQVLHLLQHSDALEDAEGQHRVLDAVLDHLVPVGGPLVVDAGGVHVQLVLSQHQLGHVGEPLPLGSQLPLHVPPRVGDDAAVGPPEAVVHLAGLRPVTTDGGGPAVGRQPVVHVRDVVAVYVVARDHVGVVALHRVQEGGQDPLLVVVHQGLGDQVPIWLPHGYADAENPPAGEALALRRRVVLEGVLYVEGHYLELGLEVLDVLEGLGPHHQIGGVPLGDCLLGLPADDAGAATDVLVVHEPHREGDVGGQDRQAELLHAAPELGDLEGEPDDHPNAVPLLALVPEGDGLPRQVVGHLLQGVQGLGGGLHQVEVGTEVLVDGRDRRAFPGPAVHLDADALVAQLGVGDLQETNVPAALGQPITLPTRS